jgi:diguanylate cyclase (GGDEF)-like protein/PAS domain S-box-containing protein
LALLFLLLVSGFAVYAWYEERNDELDRLAQLSDFAARSADDRFNFYSNSERWLGEELLRIDMLRNPAAARNLLLRFKRAHPELAGVHVIRPDGQMLLSTAAPPGSLLPDFQRIPHLWPQFRLTLETRGLHVLRAHQGLLTGLWVMPLQYAVRDARDEVVFVLNAGLPLANQQAIWRNLRLRDDAVIGLIRNDGYFQSLWPARMEENLRYMRPMDCPVSLAQAAEAKAPSGNFIGASEVCGPGTRYGAYHRLSHYPMAAFVAMPRAYFWAQWWRRVRVPFALFLFSAAAGLGIYRRERAQQFEFERERTHGQVALTRLSRRNESILEAAGEGIYGLDMEGRVMFANAAAVRVLGYEVDELVGEHIHPLVHHTRPDGSPYPADACPHYAALRRGVPSQVSDEVFWTKTGAPVPIEYTSTPIHDGGHVTGAVIVFRDITARKRHEALLAGEKQVLEMIAKSAPLPEVLIQIARLVESQSLRKTYCCVLLVDPRRERLFVGATPSLPEALVQQLDGLSLTADAPACAAAAAFGGRATIAGVDAEGWAPAIHAIAQDHGLRSCWSVPIRAGGEDEVLGAFNIYCADAQPPTAQEIAFVERAAQTAGIAIQKQRAEDRLGYLAHRDALTGLPNRILLQDRLHHATVHAGRRQLHLGVLYVDLDRFKHVNDTLGHPAGDQLLTTVARRLEESVRNVDTVARQGGDEFVVILEDVVKEEDVSDIAQKILSALGQPVVIGQSEVFVTGSIGVSVYPRDGKDPETLLKNADVAMYRAKEKGRNNFEFFTEEMNYSSAEHFAMSNRLRHALERHEFRLYYQPRVDVRAGRITGAEALLRWEHPELGLVLPSKFIPLLEDTGLIVPVGEWVLRTACAQNRAWRQAGYFLERVAVNISGLQFRHGRLESTIARVLAETGIDPQGLEIELTESLIMQDVQATAAALARLKKMGVGVAVDDFGTGYSSLSYLKRFPIDTIKIDRLFIKELTTSAEDAAIAKALIEMAHSLKLKTVAEGVETAGQLGYLRRRHCDEVQGNYFSVPVPAEEFAKLLASRRRLSSLRWR